MRLRRKLTTATATLAALVAAAPAALACGFLVAENGAIRLDTFTAAAVLDADGDASYVTAFSFNGAPESFGAIIPLPAVPVDVEKAPGWFLQRLTQEAFPAPAAAGRLAATADESADAMVLETFEVDALDITILEGGGDAVLGWALGNGFDLGVADGDPDDLTDAAAMLDFYADRSPIFAAIRFDNARAAEQGLRSGEGTPVRFAFEDQREAWIPVKVLGFDKPVDEVVEANLFLLTPDEPTILGGRVAGTEVVLQRAYEASSPLSIDLHDDERAEWIPDAFTLTAIDVDTRVSDLEFDVVAAPAGRAPSVDLAFGTAFAAAQRDEPAFADIPRGVLGGGAGTVAWNAAITGALAGSLATVGLGVWWRRREDEAIVASRR